MPMHESSSGFLLPANGIQDAWGIEFSLASPRFDEGLDTSGIRAIMGVSRPTTSILCFSPCITL